MKDSFADVEDVQLEEEPGGAHLPLLLKASHLPGGGSKGWYHISPDMAAEPG